MEKAAFLTVLLLTALKGCGAQRESSCTIGDIKADPQCMLKLTEGAKCVCKQSTRHF